jgi:hypothetical protein
MLVYQRVPMKNIEKWWSSSSLWKKVYQRINPSPLSAMIDYIIL